MRLSLGAEELREVLVYTQSLCCYGIALSCQVVLECARCFYYAREIPRWYVREAVLEGLAVCCVEPVCVDLPSLYRGIRVSLLGYAAGAEAMARSCSERGICERRG